VMNQNVPIDQALANWKALKSTYDQGFIDLYSEPRFRQMIEDYRAQYPSN
jgi:hypothetical protein